MVFLRKRDRKIVAFLHVVADAFDACLDNVIAGGAAHDVEHFEDRNAAADQLREGARKTRHANLMNERPEDRAASVSSDRAELFAAGRAQKSANAEDRAADTEDEEIPFAADEIADVDQELRRRRQFGAEILEDFAEDRDNPHDQEGGNREGDANDDDRIGHGRFDFLAQSGAGFEEAGQPVENFGQQTAVFTRFHHADKKPIEDTRMFRDRFVETFRRLGRARSRR